MYQSWSVGSTPWLHQTTRETEQTQGPQVHAGMAVVQETHQLQRQQSDQWAGSEQVSLTAEINCSIGGGQLSRQRQPRQS